MTVIEIHGRNLLTRYQVTSCLVAHLVPLACISGLIGSEDCIAKVLRVLFGWLLDQAVAIMVVVRWMTLSPQEEVAVPSMALTFPRELICFLLLSFQIVVRTCTTVVV